jgi:indolepyruvate ferredoxin oxidoreductase beta subunit
VRTTTVSGYLRVWLLARLRVLRPISWRARIENERIERWLAGVSRALTWDEALACEVAQLARLIKGYGDVRRRLLALFDTGLALSLRAAQAEARHGAGVPISTALIARFLTLVLEGPDGESRAARLAIEADARITAGEVDSLRALITTPTIA